MHECLGKHDIRERQGYYIKASNEEQAWEIMAARFPEESEAGFTVQEWQGFNVIVVEIKRDANGNIIREELTSDDKSDGNRQN
jgi:hypothetical protein